MIGTFILPGDVTAFAPTAKRSPSYETLCRNKKEERSEKHRRFQFARSVESQATL
jgi:hypothetical protein